MCLDFVNVKTSTLMFKTVVALHKLELTKDNRRYKHLAQLHWMFTRWTLDVSHVLVGDIICSDFYAHVSPDQ